MTSAGSPETHAAHPPRPALECNVTDTALLFEGGGMRAAYTSAVVTQLLRAGIFFDYVAGISAGASNAVNYLSRDAARARRSFVEFAADPAFGDLWSFARGDGLFNAEYIYERTSEPHQALPLDFATFRANPARFRIGAFQCATGRNVYWSRDDVETMRDLLVRVRASSTMPVLMPPVTIDGQVYVDGALGRSGGIPLDIARVDGYQKFFVVLTRTRDYVKGPSRAPEFFKRRFRRYPAVADAILKRWHRYNETRRKLFELEARGLAYLFFPETMPISNGERNVAKLRQTHELGRSQARRELPRWREFLGL